MTKYAISVFNYVVIVIRYARYATRSECVALPAPVAYLQPQQANLLTCAKRPPCDTVTDSNKSLLREKFTRNSVHGGSLLWTQLSPRLQCAAYSGRTLQYDGINCEN